MNEVQLRVALGIIAEPIENKLDLSVRSTREEVQRIIRIFNINKEQKDYHFKLPVSSFANFELVHSCN